ncbi:DUF4328 domain-containing protein [Streptomyces sp. NPDC057092]|uniref:DUF4328 domain-containing protein n=1 Tax=Streptomyces sp. NPDC057092 TaxID=3346017 RepID=UPI00363FD753
MTPMPAPGPVLRSPVGLSHAVTVLLGLVMLADVLNTAAAFFMRSQMDRITSGVGDVDLTDLDRADSALAGTGVFYLLALLATATVFIIWFHRVRQNAEVFAPDTQRRSAGWAIGAWFIPFANLWIPRGIALDVLRAGEPDPYGGTVRHQGLLNAWWGVWIASNVFDRLATRRYDDAESPQAVHDATGWLITGSLLDIVAAVLAVLFVRRLTAAQNAKALAGPGLPVG